MPFATTLGIRFLESGPNAVKATLDHTPGLCTTGGVLHGGAVMALADSTGGTCAFLNLPERAAGTSTIESKTNFLRAVRSGSLTATSTPLHAGRTVIVIETDVTDSDGRMVAKVIQSQAVRNSH